MDYIIPIKNDLKLIVCDKGFELYMKHIWSVHVRGGRANMYRSLWAEGRKTSMQFHRQLMGEIPSGMVVDHINGNTLDNRLVNLRKCTIKQNAENARQRKGGKSMKGASKTRSGKWLSRIKHNGKDIQLGLWDTEEEAHNAYMTKARELFGVFCTSGKTCETCGNYL